MTQLGGISVNLTLYVVGCWWYLAAFIMYEIPFCQVTSTLLMVWYLVDMFSKYLPSARLNPRNGCTKHYRCHVQCPTTVAPWTDQIAWHRAPIAYLCTVLYQCSLFHWQLFHFAYNTSNTLAHSSSHYKTAEDWQWKWFIKKKEQGSCGRVEAQTVGHGSNQAEFDYSRRGSTSTGKLTNKQTYCCQVVLCFKSKWNGSQNKEIITQEG